MLIVSHPLGTEHNLNEAVDFMRSNRRTVTVLMLKQIPLEVYLQTLHIMVDYSQQGPLGFCCAGCLAHVFQLELAAIRYLVESGLFNLRGFSLYIESYWLLEYHSQLMESCFGGSLILPRELKSLDFPDVLMNKDLANPDYSLGEFTFIPCSNVAPLTLDLLFRTIFCEHDAAAD
jgi:hypothetical protein